MNTTNKLKYEKELSYALTSIEIPDDYQLYSIIEAMQNNKPVFVFRYVKGNPNYESEHFSFTIEQNTNKILGFTWFDEQFKKGSSLPSEKETKEMAEKFLEEVAPDLLHSLDHKWTAEHDESLKIDGKTVIITGMKYKCYVPKEDRYAWVIVGHGGKVMTFEQGILWRDGRVSEKWLHDSWVKDNKKENIL